MAKKNLKTLAYEKIKQMIIEGELEGGEPIPEVKLVDVLGVSRTPIREACNLLQHEHLVEIYPKQGIFVTRISYKDVMDIYSLRILMEAHAVEIATLKMPKDRIEPLLDKWKNPVESSNFREHIADDKALHSGIIQATSNKYLIQYLDQLYDQANRIRFFSFNKSTGRMGQTHNEHVRVLEKMLEGDAEAAGQAMRDHLTNARDTALRYFE